MNRSTLFLSSLVAIAGLAATPAEAAKHSYSAALSGDSVTSKTGSKATGNAQIIVDDANGSVSVSISVSGITVEQLSSALVKAPIGPIHLHLYSSPDLSDPNSVTLALPVPFGVAYENTGTGFSVRMADYPYSLGAALLGAKASLKGFIEALDKGVVALNIHTNAFPGGEISGAILKS